MSTRKRMAPEERLRNASMLLRMIHELGGEVRIGPGGAIEHVGTGGGAAFVEQLRRHYPRETAACLGAQGALNRCDRV